MCGVVLIGLHPTPSSAATTRILAFTGDDGGVVLVATETPVGFHHTECVEDFCHFGVPIHVHRIAIRLVEVGYEDMVLGVAVNATEGVTTRAHPKAVDPAPKRPPLPVTVCSR